MIQQEINLMKESIATRLGYTSWDDYMEVAPSSALYVLQTEIEALCVKVCHKHLEDFLKTQSEATRESKLAPAFVKEYTRQAYIKQISEPYPVRL